MDLPKLDLIIETFFKIDKLDFSSYISQLRNGLLPLIRKYENEKKIIWYSFLIHDSNNLKNRVLPSDKNLYVHIRFGLPDGANINQFINELPDYFQQPQHVNLSVISGIDNSIIRNNDWAYAWKIHGEASELVLRIIEGHNDDSNISIQQITQFLHFITNPLMIGGRCLFLNNGFLQF
jgi:hypothetical protein